MSAIGGIIHLDGAPVERTDLERMSRALEPFGRDRADLQLLPGEGVSAGLVARIGHVTPEDRHDRQPHPLPDGARLLFDGRINNRPELIRRLALPPAEAARLSDGALAARAWAAWGRDRALAALVGVFGLALWEPAPRRLTLARSAPHGKPLQFHQRGGRIYFASAPNGLFALPEVPRVLDDEVVADLLLKNSGGGDSLFGEVEVVLNAHWISFTPEGRKQGRHWAPDPEHRLHFPREEEAWEAFNELFEEVVASHLRATGPIGIQMSGGLDSAAVAGQAARLLAARGELLHGYTRVPMPGTPLPPDGGGYYTLERPRVEQIAAMYPNLRPTFVHPGEGESPLGRLEEQYALYKILGVSPTFISGYQTLHRRARADGIQVLLNAAGGNLTFSHDGHPRLRQLLRRGRWPTLVRELLALRRYLGGIRGVAREELWEASIPPPLRGLFHRLRNGGDAPWAHYAAPAPALIAATGAVGRLRERHNIKLHWQHLDGWGRRFALLTQTGRGGADALMATYGMEARDPASDRRLVEFCLALPERHYLAHGLNRRLARLGLAHLIPEAIRMDPAYGRDDVDWAHRLRRHAADIDAALARLAADPEAARYLDLPAMEREWRRFAETDWTHASTRDTVRCKQALMGGIAVGGFIRWFQGGN